MIFYSIFIILNCKCKFICQHFNRNLSEDRLSFFVTSTSFYCDYILLVVLSIVLLKWLALGKTIGFPFPWSWYSVARGEALSLRSQHPDSVRSSRWFKKVSYNHLSSYHLRWPLNKEAIFHTPIEKASGMLCSTIHMFHSSH